MNDSQMLAHFEKKIKEAVMLKREERYDQAIAIYKDLFSLNPNVPQVHEGMAKTCAVSGRYRDAVECFKFASQLYDSIGDRQKASLCYGFSELFSCPNEGDPEFMEVLMALKGATG